MANKTITINDLSKHYQTAIDRLNKPLSAVISLPITDPSLLDIIRKPTRTPPTTVFPVFRNRL